jgi:hypothetical protein
MKGIYKAQRVDGKGWVEGYYVYDSLVHQIITSDFSCFNVIPETVCTYTGRQINGVNLFQGDKIKKLHFISANGKKHYLEHIVLWNNEYSCWMASVDGTTDFKRGNIQLYLYLRDMIEPEIIGNVHDKNEE